ncbi:hypothetical protein BDN70DRAFT_886525 [Pholiota conissans]|uniref:Uncharacterized protein n=1 Tax=Pholiota conissans TaxID=109636 RepID=A0A9P5YQI9_9AGAR|nr:hypothetical protein BDN70DRAFT_886525 [Pholiota conissans]
MADVEMNQWFFSGDVVLSYLARQLFYNLEVNRPRWKMPQGLFFLNRYFGLGWQIHLDVASEEVRFRTTFILIHAFFGSVVFFAMHGIMVYRVSSMYTHGRKILKILIIGFFVEFSSFIAIQVALWYYGRTLTDSDVHIQNPIGFCGKEKFSSWTFITWIPFVLFDCLICTLAVALGVRYYQEVGSRGMFPNLPNSSRSSSLLFILLRDSIVFPVVFSLSCILNLVSFYLSSTGLRPAMSHITFLLPATLSGLLGSRLILNLRESYYEPYEQEFNVQIENLTMPDNIELGGDIPMLCPNPISTTLPTMGN